MNSIAVLVLAAGLGKRMGSDRPKVVTETSEMPLIQHVLSTVAELSPKKVVVITGYKKEIVEEVVEKGRPKYQTLPVEFAFQDKQLGTGHAVKCALSNLEGFKGDILILYGDVPLIQSETLKRLISTHNTEKATITLGSVEVERPTGYGRVIRDTSGKHVAKIVESKDCTPEQAQINEINSGIYAVDSAFLKPAVESLTNNNQQGEYYLTDIVGKASEEGQIVSAFTIPDFSEVQGVNTLYELAEVNRSLRALRVRNLIDGGVYINDPDSLYVESTVEVSPGARIGPNVQLKGDTKIAAGVVIEGSALLINTEVQENSLIKFNVRAENAKIGRDCSVGPFANLRSGTVLNKKVKVGNFVETKNAVLSDNVSASHLTYLGDCSVGESTNIGAGTITCNYDGIKKHFTKIEEDVFIGSNTALVAPVTIGKNSSVGAGSVITKDVPPGSLALTRPELFIKQNYKRKK